jgi:SAM-dependent methyltransferase
MTSAAAPPVPQVPLAAQFMEMATGVLVTGMLEVLMRHRIAEHMQAGRCTPQDLAAATGLPERGLYRLLRASTALGVIIRNGKGHFALTPLGEMLETYAGSEWGLDALAAFPEALETGRSGMEVAHGMGAFEFFEQHPQAGAKFDTLMQAINAGEQEAVADAYPLDAVELLVDVGGGNGSMLAALLSRYPGLHGVLFDQPSVIGRGAPSLEAHPDRSEAVGGDFFDAVPDGGDVYLLSHVLHDWPEDGCMRILESCRRAMRPGGRVLVVEMVIPPDDSPHPGKMSDMVMIAFNGDGMERTEAEYAELFARAGFRIERVVPTASPVSIVEAVPQPR